MCVRSFVLSGALVEQVERYKYLGFVVHATKKLTFGTDALVATAVKALFVLRRRCALLGIRGPALPASYLILWCCQSELWLRSLGSGHQMRCSSRSFTLGDCNV